MNRHLSRRAFLRTATAAALIPTVGEAVAAMAKPPLIIDTHTHFYDPTRPQGVPWPDKNDNILYRKVFPSDYRALATPQPVVGTVVVEASSWLEDNQWILDLAASNPFIVGFVGNLPVGQPGFQDHLHRFARNPIFRGLRIGGDRLHSGLDDPVFLADIKELADRDLALDVLVGPEQLPDVARLAQAVPKLRIVIDHVANLRIDGQAPPVAWRDGMRALGQHRNVYCKVSGLVEGTGKTDGAAPSKVDFYRPVLDGIWEGFGPDRLIYGSNWPVSARFASLATVQGIVTAYFAERGRAATEKVFSKNAKKVYQWLKR